MKCSLCLDNRMLDSAVVCTRDVRIHLNSRKRDLRLLLKDYAIVKNIMEINVGKVFGEGIKETQSMKLYHKKRGGKGGGAQREKYI